jgi:hypothetical protein
MLVPIIGGISLMVLLVAGSFIPAVWADAENPTCIERGNCAFTSDPLGTMLLPFDMIFGGLSIVIFWGLVVGILWLRTENPALVGLVGIAMSGAYLAKLFEDGITAPAEWDSARVIGGTLFAFSLGISIYQIINSKLHAPPQ